MNNKLGRMRLDTLRDIEEQKRKDKQRKRNNPSKVFQTDGNKVLICSDYDGKCAVCGGTFKLGAFIWYDSTKPVGKKTAHRDCFTPKNV